MEETGAVPPGNMRGEARWTRRARAAKPEIKLTPGKGAADLTVPLEQILDAVVKVFRLTLHFNAEQSSQHFAGYAAKRPSALTHTSTINCQSFNFQSHSKLQVHNIQRVQVKHLSLP